MLNRWVDHELKKKEILEAIKIELFKQASVSSVRGQESSEIFVATSMSPLNQFQKENVVFRSKVETSDDLHLSHNTSLRSLLLWILEQAKELIDRIGGVAAQEFCPYVLNSWASIYRNGDFHNSHIHPASLFSCVYCISTIENGGGLLVLHDPRHNINYNHFECGLWSNNARIIDLQPGDLIIFPGWLSHSVTPIQGDGERITLSVNLDARHFPLSRDNTQAK